MLVLTRRVSEKFIIGNNIVITIVRVEGGQVRVGIDAPRDVSIVRAEIAEPKRLPIAN
jgi:carbon storage regulator